MTERADIYEEQKRLLHQLHEAHGQDIFVATYLVTTPPDGGASVSVASWSEGVHAYLPETDRIAFVGDLPDGGLELWEADTADVARVMPMARRRLNDLDPPRFEVTTFPTAAQRKATKARLLQRPKKQR
jgi:hypothetical protein